MDNKYNYFNWVEICINTHTHVLASCPNVAPSLYLHIHVDHLLIISCAGTCIENTLHSITLISVSCAHYELIYVLFSLISCHCNPSTIYPFLLTRSSMTTTVPKRHRQQHHRTNIIIIIQMNRNILRTIPPTRATTPITVRTASKMNICFRHRCKCRPVVTHPRPAARTISRVTSNQPPQEFIVNESTSTKIKSAQ